MLKKIFLTLVTTILLLSINSAIAANYKIDNEGQHAFIQFRIQHLGYSWVYGSFKNFTGSFTFDEKNPQNDQVKVVINTASIDTNHAERDKHLRSADFFNVKKYPEATFISTKVSQVKGAYHIEGQLTLNGVTKPLVLNAILIGKGDDPWGGYRVGFEATGKIKLKDFNFQKDLGPKSQEAELIISLEGVKLP
ncbi:YceI family protein [Arsenophonus nasoniae]|nr:YceI family protein [Arsenophonus nasoniae]QBY44653.1 Protein YceI [Arsenophonus nasoniae]WGL94512.1 YceI family protein [Arsenophonus nasoniae]WGM00854.1 YceI family protein [Arsenophonus nasoniae]WGM04892.1 YceI family protein [Arsenophonus nasoniae]WGM09991.1 YceI family protein [Arsenophonus nasoniae]